MLETVLDVIQLALSLTTIALIVKMMRQDKED